MVMLRLCESPNLVSAGAHTRIHCKQKKNRMRCYRIRFFQRLFTRNILHSASSDNLNLSPTNTAHFGCIEECVFVLCAEESRNSTSCFLICCFTFSSVGSAGSDADSISYVATRIGNRQIQKIGQCDRLPSLPYRQGHFNKK